MADMPIYSSSPALISSGPRSKAPASQAPRPRVVARAAQTTSQDTLSLSGTGRRLPTSPPGQLMVVNANLMEVFPNHLGRPEEMRTFVQRLLAKASHMPDALLLSEVSGDSAAQVARLLSEATGQRFVVAANPGSVLLTPDGAKNETAVLLNLDTMKPVGKGGHLRMNTTHEEKAPSMLAPENKMTAYASARERDGGLRLAMAALHFSHNKEMANEPLAKRKKAEWMDQIAQTLDQAFKGKPHANVIAGDFNNPKYKEGKAEPFLELITGKRGYKDVFAEEKRGIDHIFTSGEVLGKYDDKVEYDQKAARLDGTFYSDHAFQWALVGQPGEQAKEPWQVDLLK